MQVTLTAKLKLTPTSEQFALLQATIRTVKQALNYTSRYAFQHQVMTSVALNYRLYRKLRTTFGLRSQMTQSVFRTVAAKYQSMKSNQGWNLDLWDR